MIIVKTPLRISLGGGGTDLPSYYSKHGSMFLSAGINKYIYTTFHKSEFNPNIRLRYSQMEEVKNVNDIRHEIFRETLKFHNITNSVEITSHAEIPSGTGLGSSGTFGVGLSHALWTFKEVEPTEKDLAEEATKIQIDILKLPVGKQDQYASAFGGLLCYNIDKDGEVKTSSLSIDYQLLREKLVLFFTGYSRDSNQILEIQKVKTDINDLAMTQNLYRIQKLGYESKIALENNDFDKFGELMNEHWMFKKQRAIEMSNPLIDNYYDRALKNGAIGGKLIGAGGGGFLMFITNDREKLVKTLKLKELEFDWDFLGSTVIYNDKNIS